MQNSLDAQDASRFRWTMIMDSLKRPYPVSIPMVVFVSLIPFYVFIAEWISGRRLNVPALALDHAVPLLPAWAFVYGSLYLWLIMLPVLIVRQQRQIHRTVLAYLTIWIVSYICFLIYPTVAPRPASLIGDGFAIWGLSLLYSADPPYNCFPSLHVAHSFVSALTSYHVHRGVGIVAVMGASLVGLSTLFTKQHYILDVIAGIFLACVAYFLFLRKYQGEKIPALDRQVAPFLALGIIGFISLIVAGFWIAYFLRRA